MSERTGPCFGQSKEEGCNSDAHLCRPGSAAGPVVLPVRQRFGGPPRSRLALPVGYTTCGGPISGSRPEANRPGSPPGGGGPGRIAPMTWPAWRRRRPPRPLRGRGAAPRQFRVPPLRPCLAPADSMPGKLAPVSSPVQRPRSDARNQSPRPSVASPRRRMIACTAPKPNLCRPRRAPPRATADTTLQSRRCRRRWPVQFPRAPGVSSPASLRRRVRNRSPPCTVPASAMCEPDRAARSDRREKQPQLCEPAPSRSGWRNTPWRFPHSGCNRWPFPNMDPSAARSRRPTPAASNPAKTDLAPRPTSARPPAPKSAAQTA